MFEGKKIAFIGTGAMAEAIIRGLVENGVVSAEQITGSNPLASRNEHMATTYGIGVTTDNVVAATAADVVVLSVKPQIFPYVVPSLTGNIAADALIVSVMAGVTIETMMSALDVTAVVRSMPNTPAQIGMGMTAWTATAAVSAEQSQQAQAIFQALGEEVRVLSEPYLDMATAMSGSGPGYIFLMLEAYIDAGVQIGFPRDIAEKLALQTMRGAAEYMHQSGQHPTLLRNQVTSPGGTTAAGLYAMEKAGLRTAIAEGVRAALARSIELGKK